MEIVRNDHYNLFYDIYVQSIGITILFLKQNTTYHKHEKSTIMAKRVPASSNNFFS